MIFQPYKDWYGEPSPPKGFFNYGPDFNDCINASKYILVYRGLIAGEYNSYEVALKNTEQLILNHGLSRVGMYRHDYSGQTFVDRGYVGEFVNVDGKVVKDS